MLPKVAICCRSKVLFFIKYTVILFLSFLASQNANETKTNPATKLPTLI